MSASNIPSHLTHPAATGANAPQIEHWNGETGKRWTQHQDRLDEMLEPFSAALLDLAAIREGESIMDIGCGCGATTFEMAAKAGRAGQALGVDISAPMIARAKERAAAAGSHAEFLLADAATHSFAPQSFDLLASRFGIMFFVEPVEAFSHLRKALKAEGRIAFVCWRPMPENDWVSVPLRATLPHVPKPEPMEPGAPGPFAFGDKDRFSKVLKEAGFSAITIEPGNADLLIGRKGNAVEDALEQSLDIGPLSRLLKGMDEDRLANVKNAVRKELAHHEKDGEIRLGGAVWLVSARA